MNTVPRQRGFVWVAPIVMLLVSAAVSGQEPAGTVMFVAGSVSVQRGQIQALAKGDAIAVGDVISTGSTGRAQLAMADGAKLAIRPDSRFRIDDFSHTEPETPPSAPVVTATMDRSFMSLLKGGFRTITGLIGQADEEAYEVRTPVGTLGIRGTDYAAVFCLSDCVWAPGLTSGQPPEDGLYIGVTLGVVLFSNELAELEIEAGEYAFIPIIDRLPRLLVAPPPVLLDQFDLDVQPDPTTLGQAGAEALRGFDTFSVRLVPASSQAAVPSDVPEDETGRGADAPAQPLTAFDADGIPVNLTAGLAPAPDPRSISYAIGPLGTPPAFPFSGTRTNAPGEYALDGNNNLVGFVGPYPARSGSVDGTFALGTATLTETGFDSMTQMRWGRWEGGLAEITLPGGVDASQDLSNQSAHWVSGPQFTSPPSIPVVGFASYALIGGTAPTDNAGNLGVLGSATFAADFTNLSVASTVDLGVGASAWSATGTGVMGPLFDPAGPVQDFQGFYNAVTIDGVGGGSGVFSGFFSEPGAGNPTLPGGVGLTYSLQDMNGAAQVSGALIFANPN